MIALDDIEPTVIQKNAKEFLRNTSSYSFFLYSVKEKIISCNMKLQLSFMGFPYFILGFP